MSACLARAWKVATAVDLHMDLVRQLYVYCTIKLKKSSFINGSCPILVLNMVLGRLGVGVGASRLIWARFEN